MPAGDIYIYMHYGLLSSAPWCPSELAGHGQVVASGNALPWQPLAELLDLWRLEKLSELDLRLSWKDEKVVCGSEVAFCQLYNSPRVSLNSGVKHVYAGSFAPAPVAPSLNPPRAPYVSVPHSVTPYALRAGSGSTSAAIAIRSSSVLMPSASVVGRVPAMERSSVSGSSSSSSFSFATGVAVPLPDCDGGSDSAGVAPTFVTLVCTSREMFSDSTRLGWRGVPGAARIW